MMPQITPYLVDSDRSFGDWTEEWEEAIIFTKVRLLLSMTTP